MASATIPPDPSASFDSLWEFDEPEADALPAALQPPGGLPPKVPATLRDTLLPPVPPPEYVQTMMELGELDDPSDVGLGPRRAAPTPVPQEDWPGEPSLGLVLASESEMLLSHGSHVEDTAPVANATVQIRGALGSPPLPGRVAGMNRAIGGMSALGRGAPVIPGAPAPRAPSIIPPQPQLPRDVRQEDLDEDLDLMPFEEPVASHGAPFEEASPVATPSFRLTPPGGLTRTPISSPHGSPRTSPPQSGGLRLGKTPPPMAAAEPIDRITPIASEPPPDSVVDQLRVMQLRFDARNYPGALVLAESILVSSPSHGAAKQCAESCRDMMAEKYLSRIGGRNCVPRVVIPPEEMHRLALDHRAGFLLSFIDGVMSVDEVLDVSSMPELDALRIMFELQEQGAIAIEAPARRPGRK